MRTQADRDFDLEAGRDIERKDAEIARLSDALWEYGDHRPACRISSGKECDCGFFEIIKSLKD